MASCHRPSPYQLFGSVQARLEGKGMLRKFTMEEVSRHNTKDDAYIVVGGRVYDITRHVAQHAGWTCGCATSELLAILRTLGTECTAEVMSVHSTRALARLATYQIGVLEAGAHLGAIGQHGR